MEENFVLQGNPIHALGQSISFGRFVSESLAWEKWSTFSHNRYVEEAERFSQPGSVAQKKAFFEAHYKKLAARKAAALLEQANAEAGNDAKTESENGFTPQESEVVVDDEKVAKEGEKDRNLDVGVNGYDSNVKRDEFEGSKVEVADEGSVDSQQLNGTAKMDKLSPKVRTFISKFVVFVLYSLEVYLSFIVVAERTRSFCANQQEENNTFFVQVINQDDNQIHSSKCHSNE